MGGRGSSSMTAATADTSYQGNRGYRRAQGSGAPLSEEAGRLLRNAEDRPKLLEATSWETGEHRIVHNDELEAQLRSIDDGARTVTIYRATPGSTINRGDWVFLSYVQADTWRRSRFTGAPREGWNVLVETVPVDAVQWTGKNLEFVKVR